MTETNRILPVGRCDLNVDAFEYGCAVRSVGRFFGSKDETTDTNFENLLRDVQPLVGSFYDIATGIRMFFHNPILLSSRHHSRNLVDFVVLFLTKDDLSCNRMSTCQRTYAYEAWQAILQCRGRVGGYGVIHGRAKRVHGRETKT